MPSALELIYSCTFRAFAITGSQPPIFSERQASLQWQQVSQRLGEQHIDGIDTSWQTARPP